eukprot:TRINITY_DN16026_c0_g1_i1.p1 TRINITY_DN16026_c0_g1~~TRINITY_DN16026_c0_g1_i1.p1  ORF type:complete len:176 (+),score=60.34 TRINITY_DN16026_c0_g1_i1:33-560(+)
MYTPFSFAIRTEEWIRVGFEEHELNEDYNSKKILSEIGKFFAVSHQINPKYEIIVIPVLPNQQENLNNTSIKTVKNFVQHRGFYRVKVLKGTEQMDQDKLEEYAIKLERKKEKLRKEEEERKISETISQDNNSMEELKKKIEELTMKNEFLIMENSQLKEQLDEQQKKENKEQIN